MSADLRSKTVRAIGHLGLGGALGKIVSLGTTLILARLLSPADYGLMAMAMVVIGFVGFFNEVGIGSAIVQKPKLSTAEVNGCFAIAIMASAVLSGLTYLLSGVMARFFGNPHLEAMIAVLSCAFILGAFGTVPLAFLRKELHFKAIAGITILAIVVQSAVCLVLAWRGLGVWSLVWGFVVSSAVQSVGAFWLSSWRPRGAYGMREAGGLVLYGLKVTSSRVFWYLYTNADKVIIGKVLGERALGIYDMAFSLATLPSSQITTLATNVASPLFAKLQDDLPKMNAFILHFTRGIAYVTYPALIGMLVCSPELVSVMLGAKWVDLLIPFGALCLMGLIKSVDPLLSQVLIATGNAGKLSAYTLMCGVAMTIAVLVGAHFDGLRGVSAVWLLVYPVLSIKLLHDVCKITGMRMAHYYRSLLPVLSATIAMAVVVLLVRAWVLALGIPVLACLVAEIAAGALSYVLWIVYLDRRGMSEIKQVLIDLGIGEQRLARWPFNRVALPIAEQK
ncbi:MAG: lipopolysaccharide biosynthesis protein [Pseudomonadota bacterium]